MPAWQQPLPMILWKCSPLSGSPPDCSGRACRVSALLLKDPPFPVRAPHVGSHGAQFSSLKPRAIAGVSGPQSPCPCQKEGHGGSSSGVLGGGGQVPPCPLDLPPATAGVAMVTKQAFPLLYPPAPHPQTRPFQGPRLLGVMETVSRHPQWASPLAGRACR